MGRPGRRPATGPTGTPSAAAGARIGSIGGKARIPGSFPDGTSNTISFVERYAECGDTSIGTDQSKWNGYKFVSHTWSEDSDGGCASCPGPVSEHYNNDAWESPAFWMSVPNSVYSGYDNPSHGPKDYPIDPATGHSNYLALPQQKPTVLQCDPTRVQAMSSGGMLVGLMDGSVRNVSSGVSVDTLARALVPNDGFVLGNDW